ncbi:MAG TPA: glucoamylase family protein [Verrucomicrobiae bacterium]|nr:glucoamylase family protein [Verrucomicrobiae bacterium]
MIESSKSGSLAACSGAPAGGSQPWQTCLRGFIALLICCCAAMPSLSRGENTELRFMNFNYQGPFNNFSGDNGTFAAKKATVDAAFDNRVFYGTNGASLRIDYGVSTGFCGVWYSLLGKASYPKFTLNFTNLYGPLRNSTGNPSRVENVRVTDLTFRARGDGVGEFTHNVKVELKSPDKVLGSDVFDVPNDTNWVRCDFPIARLEGADVSQVKEMVFVIEDWRNNSRTGHIYVDDLSFITDEPAYNPVTWSDDALLDLIAQRAFLYFATFTDNLGFALDRSTYSDMVSVGTIGFQLSAYCIAHQRGWASRPELEKRVVTILRHLHDLPMGPESGTARAGYRGFFYHFLTADIGRRKDNRVELSLYDTMLLMYGVLTCKEYFPDNHEIQNLSQQLFDRVEWNWFVDRSPGPNFNRFHLAWQPGPKTEGTFTRHVDGQTDEAFMVDVLGIGSRTHPTSLDNYLARNRVFGSYPDDGHPSIMVSWKGSLFNYFFASCWMDFRNRGLDMHPTAPRDIWHNDKLAILANRQFCIDHAARSPGINDGRYATYGENAWGLTACDNLVPPSAGLPSEYFSFGSLPSEENIRFGTWAQQVGTLAVYGAISSINFVPETSIAALRHYLVIPDLWSPLFGLGDAFSLDPHYITAPYDTRGNPTVRHADYLNGPWINPMIMGINAGPMLLAIENYRTGLIWKLTSGNHEIATGLDGIFGASTPHDVAVSVSKGDAPHKVNLQWKPEPGISAYSVYASTNLETWSLLQKDIKGTNWTDIQPTVGPQCYYQVKGIR